MFTDPVGLLEARYGWGTADFAGQEFVTNLGAVLEVFGEPVRLRQLPRRVEEQLAGKLVPEADPSPATQLIVSIDRSGDAQNGRDIGLSLYPLRASAAGATDAGVAIAPFVHGAAELSFPLAPRVALEFDSTVALDSGVALAFRPGKPAALKGGLLGDDGVVDSIDGRALLRVVLAAPTDGRVTLLSFPGGGVLDADSIAFAGGVEAASGKLSPSFGAKIKGGRAAIKIERLGFVPVVDPSGQRRRAEVRSRRALVGIGRRELRRLGIGRHRLPAAPVGRPAAHRCAAHRPDAVRVGRRRSKRASPRARASVR